MRRPFPALVVLSLCSTAHAADPCAKAKVQESAFGDGSLRFKAGTRPFFITKQVAPWSWTVDIGDDGAALTVLSWITGTTDYLLQPGYPMDLATTGGAVQLTTDKPTTGTSFVYDGKSVMTKLELRFPLGPELLGKLDGQAPTAIRLVLPDRTAEVPVQKGVSKTMKDAFACAADRVKK